MSGGLYLPPNKWLKAGGNLPSNVYSSVASFAEEYPEYENELEDFIEEMEEKVMSNVSLQFFPKTVQVKDGYIGQLVMNNHIVWETVPQDTEEDAETVLGMRIVTAMQTLFEIVPELTFPSKAITNDD